MLFLYLDLICDDILLLVLMYLSAIDIINLNHILNMKRSVLKPQSYIYDFIVLKDDINPRNLWTYLDINLAKVLLLSNQKINNNKHRSPLMFSISQDQIESAVLLIRSGFDINMIYEEYQYTPLMLASVNGNVKMLKILIQLGAAIDIKNKYNNTALDYAKIYKKIDAIYYLECIKIGKKLDFALI